MLFFDNTNSFLKLKSVLDELGFEGFYNENISRKPQRINYGTRKGLVHFSGVQDAGDKYTYKDDKRYTVGINSQVTPEAGVDLLLQW